MASADRVFSRPPKKSVMLRQSNVDPRCPPALKLMRTIRASQRELDRKYFAVRKGPDAATEQDVATDTVLRKAFLAAREKAAFAADELYARLLQQQVEESWGSYW